MRTYSPPMLWAMLAIAAVCLALSGWHPYDRVTWLMEVLPALIVAPLLIATYPRYPLTRLLYWLILLHAIVLMAGGAYTYARVPFGFWLQELLGTVRNPYDKVGHLMQGIVPAIAAREILLRGAYVRTRRMLAFIVVCIVLAISACYEFIEWWSALAMGQGADEFLGLQGDEWDTQSDMLFAMIGAILAQLGLGRLHDAQLGPMPGYKSPDR
ncbi:DUF2238 domain-containing protein [Massilia sp. TS11]|uniref:DUF2238 domain-containing protein n=1 Tax=Massilia sp. TS11 TaxID=2908003 RepID=UPI001EDBE510|nr:DUF2238 domain-containing protein [Massilia sp. TS11]MCG2586231.1 DUF2238 domain-containing protein [Massilia sp. TS11]